MACGQHPIAVEQCCRTAIGNRNKTEALLHINGHRCAIDNPAFRRRLRLSGFVRLKIVIRRNWLFFFQIQKGVVVGRRLKIIEAIAFHSKTIVSGFHERRFFEAIVSRRRKRHLVVWTSPKPNQHKQ